MKLLILVGLLFVYKFLINFINYWKCKSYFDKYREYSKNPKWEFHQEAMEIKRLLKGASLEDPNVLFAERAGFGQVLSGKLSVMDNLLNTEDQEIVGNVVGLFHNAIGVYRHRMSDVFNPFYWINVVIFLPREILRYIGLDSEKVLGKLVQVGYWFVGLVVSFMYGVYKDSIDALVKGWISHLAK